LFAALSKLKKSLEIGGWWKLVGREGEWMLGFNVEIESSRIVDSSKVTNIFT